MILNLGDKNSENKSALLDPVTFHPTAHPLRTTVEFSVVPALGPPLLQFSWAGAPELAVLTGGPRRQ